MLPIIWSKELAEGNVTKKMPAAQGPITTERYSTNKRRNATTKTKTRRRGKDDREEGPIVDPANSNEVSKAISSNSVLTDRSDWLSNNLTTHMSSKTSHTYTNRIIKFHGTRVDNVIIRYTSKSWDNPEMTVVTEFDTSKITGEFETINIQAVADYITITFYKQEHSSLILRREMIPAYKVEQVWINDTK